MDHTGSHHSYAVSGRHFLLGFYMKMFSRKMVSNRDDEPEILDYDWSLVKKGGGHFVTRLPILFGMCRLSSTFQNKRHLNDSSPASEVLCV